MLFFEYLNGLTVKELREIAKATGTISGYSSMKKQELITSIEYRIDADWNEALKEHSERFPMISYIIPGSDIVVNGKTAEFIMAHDKRVKRYNPLFRRDKSGMVVLTPKQRRRIAKKDRKSFGKAFANVS